MRIIGIEGLWRHTRNPIWKNLEYSFIRQFPGADFTVEMEYFCQPWEFFRLRGFADRIVQTHDDGEELLLVGHSFGGVIACSIANRFRKSDVMGIATVFSPHSYFCMSLVVPCTHGVPDAPIVSFGGDNDPLVRWGTRHHKAVHHVDLPTDHWQDVAAKTEYSDVIAAESKKYLFSST